MIVGIAHKVQIAGQKKKGGQSCKSAVAFEFNGHSMEIFYFEKNCADRGFQSQAIINEIAKCYLQLTFLQV